MLSWVRRGETPAFIKKDTRWAPWRHSRTSCIFDVSPSLSAFSVLCYTLTVSSPDLSPLESCARRTEIRHLRQVESGQSFISWREIHLKAFIFFTWRLKPFPACTGQRAKQHLGQFTSPSQDDPRQRLALIRAAESLRLTWLGFLRDCRRKTQQEEENVHTARRDERGRRRDSAGKYCWTSLRGRFWSWKPSVAS